MTIAAYMRFGAVGVKSAFQKYVAEATGSGDYGKADRLLSTGCVAMFAISLAGLIPIAFFSSGLARAAGVPTEFIKSTSGAISVLAVIMVLSNVGAVFEAIVMGGHRIDIARRFNVGFAIAEALLIVTLLHYGFGLLAMATVMGLSEIGFVVCCYLASRRVLPQIHVKVRYATWSVLRELVRFAGSYQLVSVLQILYAAILPVTILRAFGADHAGIYALSLRLISPAQMLQDAFLLSILSGGSMVYASGAIDKMQKLLHKSYKVTFLFAFVPMSFLACFGAAIIFAWTGQNAPEFHRALTLIAVAGVFQSVSVLGLVLYRISGNALLDNVRQVLVILTLLSVTMFAHRIGFYGVLGGLAFAEMLGMLFMIYAVSKTFRAFRPAELLSDALRMALATAGVLSIAVAAFNIPISSITPRQQALAHAMIACTTCLLTLVPALLLSRFISVEEGKQALRAVLPPSIRASFGKTPA